MYLSLSLSLPFCWLGHVFSLLCVNVSKVTIVIVAFHLFNLCNTQQPLQYSVSSKTTRIKLNVNTIEDDWQVRV